MLATVLAAGTLMLGGSPAMAAAGDYTLTLSAPDTVAVGANYNYVTTVDFEGVDSSNPASGVVLTTTLPEGTKLAGVPTGDSSPVLSYTYDAATRVLAMTLKDTSQDLLSVVYTVSQVDRAKKYEGFPLDAVITGTGGPSGTVSSAPVHTTVTGSNDYRARKSATVITGGNNRTVTYHFNVCSATTANFSAYTHKLTDVLPAGAELVAASSGFGSWDTSAWPAAEWTHAERLDPTTTCLDAGGARIWLTVNYPADVAGWENGQLPPVNTVALETADANGAVHAGSPATAQGPAFLDATPAPVAAISKVSTGSNIAGYISTTTSVNASYLAPPDAPDADALTVTDSGAAGGGADSWYHHNHVTSLEAGFNEKLAAANLPYTVEYQTDFSGTWQSFVPQNATTNTNLYLTVQNTGSTGWGGVLANNVLELPVGSVLTGWRVIAAPGAETVPGGSEVRFVLASVPVFRDIADGVFPADAQAGVSAGAATNVATVQAGALTAEASDAYTPVDSVYLTTHIKAPEVLSVGDTGTYRAGIVNSNPSETYSDAKMSVVLPCGIFYDPAKPIVPVTSVTVGVDPVPAIGAGVTVTSTQRVTDAAGCEQQVVTFAFDKITPMRAPGTASDRWVESNGWQYDIPVSVLPQAYVPDASTVHGYSYAYSGDKRFISVADGGTAASTVPMRGYNLFFGDDIHNFDPARNTVAVHRDQTTINTAGGLLIGKLSSAAATGPWALDSVVDKGAFWQIYVSNILPNPVTGLTFFDRLPAVATGDDFDVVLSGAVTGAPAGATVEYSTNATDATTGTWTTDPANATAFRVVLDAIASGQDFTLVVPTQTQGDTSYGKKATNVVSATGTYNGNAVQFASNEAAVSVVGAPSLEIVKKTNGKVYTSAPGAIVTNGSDVTWTYEVTNSGDTPLADVAVSDAFTAGDGSNGTLTPTSSDSGALAPGDTRIFTATGKATAGQYHNTATATGTATDKDGVRLAQQPAPATAESWYLTGDASLSVAKTTNGEHVDAAPGPQLVPGSDVKWTYTVKNTGNLVLKDVLVVDKDSAGNTVFSETVASLEPGASVVLSAQGKAVEGQYKNTVTASAVNPNGGPDLSVSDDSFYFGVVSGLSVVKTTNGEHVDAAPGPQLVPGSDVKWTYTVKNTGNLALKDVLVVDKDSAGNTVFSETVASLEPGASVVLSAQGKAVEGQYKNTVTASAVNPNGGPDLSVADDSFYFGATPGLKVSKLVSTQENGPWAEIVDVELGGTVYWQLSATNTGNTVLTDVRFDDPALGAIDPVDTLAPGETVTRVIAQTNVTESYTNVVVVSGKGPGGENPGGSGSAEVKVKPPVVVPSKPKLPDTGATGVVVSLLGAVLLLTAGGLALYAGRRRKTA
ncbi:UNVERIFIED_ORG: LPXTG-motif cell wall-anchored protein [Paenarthrobacter nicotinovorans]